MKATQANLGGIDLYQNPLQAQGGFIKAVNVDSYPYGGIKKRAGYETFLGTTNGSVVTDLFQWTNDSGSQSYLYAKKGNVLQYYDVTAGTGDWATCGNGTVAGTANVGHTVLGNTLMIGDGVNATRHTTNGTAFTNTSGAPISGDFEQYQRRVYAIGTSNTAFYSTTNDATNWSGAGTADSSSFDVPGEGRLIKVHKLADRLIFHKAGSNMFRWDGYSLVDIATNYGLASPQSYAKSEDYGFWLNRSGIYGSGGDKPDLISNSIQPLIYNDFGTGIAGTTFDSAPGACFKYDYYLSVGNISDDITQETITNAVIKYNYQKNNYFVYSFADKPTALVSYKNNAGVESLIFGDSVGQVYKFGGTATSDNGKPIEARTEMVMTGDSPFDFKRFNEYSASFNPGSQAKLQIGISDTFRRDSIKLTDVGDTSLGAIHWRFPQGSRSKILYIRLSENSTGPRFIWYGHSIDFDVENTR